MRKRFRQLCCPLFAPLVLALPLAGCNAGPKGRAAHDATDSAMATGAGTLASTPLAAGVRGDAVSASSVPIRADVPIAAPAAPDAAAADRSFNASAAVAGLDEEGAMLVRQGQASIEVKRVDDAVARVRQAAAQHGGFVADATVRGGRDETRAASLTLRIPTAQFDAVVASLSELGRVESVTASAQDVGDEYVDLTARAANARRLEARLGELLATRTGKLSDVLSMEQELARVREEIERYDGRLKHLERRATLSTLAISLHEPLPLVDRPNAGPLAEAFGRAWERALGVVAWCIASLGVLIPLGLLAFAGVGVARWGRRRLNESRA